MLKNKGFRLIIGKAGEIPGYIYYIRVGGGVWMPDAGCAYGGRRWGCITYIYKKNNPINPIKSGMRLTNIRDDGGF